MPTHIQPCGHCGAPVEVSYTEGVLEDGPIVCGVCQKLDQPPEPDGGIVQIIDGVAYIGHLA